MNRSCRPTRPTSLLRIASICGALLVAAPSTARGQQEATLSAGDSIRVDGEIVGRVLSINEGVLNVVSREAPRCRAGLMHGDAPICDPAPIIRHTVRLDEVSVERRLEKSHLILRMLAGGAAGAAAFGLVGYVIGPELGFGQVDGCVPSGARNDQCAPEERQYTADEYASLQKRSDQRKGAFFFGLLGGTGAAIVVRHMSIGWVRIEPIVSASPSEPWGVGFSVPAFR